MISTSFFILINPVAWWVSEEFSRFLENSKV